MAVPYVLQIKNVVNTIHLADIDDTLEKTAHSYLPEISTLPRSMQLPVPILAPVNVHKANNITHVLQSNEEAESQISYVYHTDVYRMVYPGQIAPQPTKRGRKKKNIQEPEKVEKEPAKILKPAPRTRSGRVVKVPKHMEKDFKKVETKETKKSIENDEDIKTSDFATFTEEILSEPIELSQLDFHQRRRKIAAQYRCPKCLKAYLGKTKMIQHIKKYPDHGPIPQKESSKVNFEVWNYLVDITQRCSRAQRGIKFCEELTNLLHNVLLLTSALFKKVDKNKNFVEVDKVLGNAIGLSPGFYFFNETELYKDVTVLKLITNTDFFKPVDSTERQKEKPKSVSVKTEITERQKEKPKSVCVKTENIVIEDHNLEEYTNYIEEKPPEKSLQHVYFKPQENLVKHSPNYCIPSVEGKIPAALEDIPDDYGKKHVHIDSELLPDNSLLHLSNIRNTVDELMLTSVDPGGTLLDNSTSSDEVMNVDQFVNERFKKITEPDLELGTASLNLDLPSLDLFHFHTT